ncbi:hypothetical protein CP97_09310 [Aurantiacibacter atlanticus]|uniref:Lipoprotein n=1 Tax=Aurantiacibacter atlanticus TaxID=1648404 RepID=A0A0H4VGF1_9SPHN|nr:hypothetical protein [Aurantiacibacter atlanticus]AKQ42174.1 hypothetical protein CP97_09310 [Aurantiacibacter atlanticus]MDF1833582.1 hypothetical protein [Alteraurantiacibacter sp. bin_em_oilr2.035]
MMRALLLVALWPALAACGAGNAASSGQYFDCALGGAVGFEPVCTSERAEMDGKRLLILRHPDGTFRRFELGVEGRGIITADGIEQAQVTSGSGLVEIRVGPDRYRVPVAQ